MPEATPPRRWDIFCRVVDNFGDIGVCWRLARQLVMEHGLQVTLWVDDLASFQRLCPELQVDSALQTVQGVHVRHWLEGLPEDVWQSLGEVVIEAFGCELPAACLAVMATRSSQGLGQEALWLNLEYLSAEDWVGGCHGRPSPHPCLPLTRYFFFPGFTPATGGLLREAGLQKRQREAGQAGALQQWLVSQGLPAEATFAWNISLFCYENNALPHLLEAWQQAEQPLRCLVPEGRSLVQVAGLLGQAALRAGDCIMRGALTVQALPFVRQEEYDRLLWACDLNFVRGEDSFVRAQWAARPMVWHIYPQDGQAHQVKLDAFMRQYAARLEPAAAAAWESFWRLWNGDPAMNGKEVTAAWQAFSRHLAAYERQAADWAQYLGEQEDLAGQLVAFSKNCHKKPI